MPVLQHADTPPPLASSSREHRAHETQIFVDDSGRRARRVRMAGLALVTTCACWLGALTVGMAGFTGFSPITAGLVPATLHHVLAGRPADHDRVPVSNGRARLRTRPVHLVGPAHPLTPSRA
jgi:hypothetical protein